MSSGFDSGVRLGEGHVTIERPEFRVSRRIEDRLPAGVRRAAEAAFSSPEVAPRVVATTAKLAVTGLASSAAGSRPAPESSPWTPWRRRRSARSTTG